MSRNSGTAMLRFEEFIANGVVYSSLTDNVTIYFSASGEKYDLDLTKEQAQSLLTRLQDAIK
jgi:hypothetical protein